MNNVQLKDWIEILGIISSLILSGVAIWVSIKSNKIALQATIDNNRMIEETMRPEVTLYPVSYLNSDARLVLIIKNIGSSSCSISSINSDYDFIKNNFLVDVDSGNPLDALVGTTLGPNQSRMIHLNGLNVPEQRINFNYSYSSSVKTYNEIQSIDFMGSTKLPMINASTKGQELKHIYHTLLEMLWKSF